MLLKIIYFVMCMIGIAYGVNAIRVRRIRFVLWTMREPGDPFYGHGRDANTFTGYPAVVLGAATIALCLYLLKLHVF